MKIGVSYDGDIAIDDIAYSTTACLTGSTTTIAPSLITDLNCNFDANSICKWQNDPTGQFRWTTNKGPTSTILTGPAFDQ